MSTSLTPELVNINHFTVNSEMLSFGRLPNTVLHLFSVALLPRCQIFVVNPVVLIIEDRIEALCFQGPISRKSKETADTEAS